MAYLKIDHVSISFQRAGATTEVLRDVNLAIEKGEYVSIIGHSGCGKSTVLNIVAGLLEPSQGGVLLEGKAVSGPGPDRAVVFQNHSLLPWLTVRENVDLAVNKVFRGRKSKAERRDWTRHNLELVHMAHAENKRPHEISGGMKQRVGIARALATRPPVLLMDEPFGALDAQTRSIMQEELLKIWSEFKTTVVFVTHDVDEALYLSDRVFAMNTAPGGIKEEIRIDLARPRTPDVALSERYGALNRRVRRLIREETLKVFNGTSR